MVVARQLGNAWRRERVRIEARSTLGAGEAGRADHQRRVVYQRRVAQASRRSGASMNTAVPAPGDGPDGRGGDQEAAGADLEPEADGDPPNQVRGFAPADPFRARGAP